MCISGPKEQSLSVLACHPTYASYIACRLQDPRAVSASVSLWLLLLHTFIIALLNARHCHKSWDMHVEESQCAWSPTAPREQLDLAR